MVQELRKNKRRIQRHEEVNPFSGMVYCADCGSKMYLCRSVARTEFQEHLKCAKNSLDKEECSAQAHFAELKRARKMLAQSEKRISELNKLFKRLYEDNVSGKLSDERYELLSKDYDREQKQLDETVKELTTVIEEREQKTSDINQFIKIVQKYAFVSEITPEIMHELIERIEIHAPDKSSGHRQQKIDIYFRFNIAQASVIADTMDYDRKRKAA